MHKNTFITLLSLYLLILGYRAKAQDTLHVAQLLKNIDSLTVSAATYEEVQRIVFFFLDDSCSISLQYRHRMMKLVAEEETYTTRFYGVNSGAAPLFVADSLTGSSLVVMENPGRRLTRFMGITKLPTVVLLTKVDEKHFALAYKGPLDNDPAQVLDEPVNYIKPLLSENIALPKAPMYHPGCIIK